MQGTGGVVDMVWVTAVVLWILRFILWMLLILLGLILLILLVPLRYEILVVKEDAWDGKIRVTWLGPVVRFQMELRSGEKDLFLLGIGGKSAGRFFSRMMGFFIRQGSARKGKPGDLNAEEKLAEDVQSVSEKMNGYKEQDLSAEEDLNVRDDSIWKETEEDQKGKKQGMFAFIQGILKQKERILDFPHWAEILQESFALLKRLVRFLKPARFRLTGIVGFDDPSVTGYTLGAAAVLQGMTGWPITIAGDFEGKALSGELEVRGRVFLVTLMYGLGRFVIRAPWRRLIRHYSQRPEPGKGRETAADDGIEKEVNNG